MWAAWGMAVFGVYRAVVYFSVDTLLRVLIVAAVAFSFAIGVVLVNRWFKSGTLAATNVPDSHPQTGIPQKENPHTIGDNPNAKKSKALAKVSKPEDKANVHPQSGFPVAPGAPTIIQASVQFIGTPRIIVPVGQMAYVAGLITGPSLRKEIPLYQLDNRDGNTAIWWPPKDFLDVLKQQDPNAVFWTLKCDVTNHGDTNLIKVIVPLVVHFIVNNGQQQQIERQVTVGPIDRGATKTFYIVNNCTLPGAVTLPRKGYAHVPGEPEAREFDFEWVDVGATGMNYGINPSVKGFPWTSVSCQ